MTVANPLAIPNPWTLDPQYSVHVYAREQTSSHYTSDHCEFQAAHRAAELPYPFADGRLILDPICGYTQDKWRHLLAVANHHSFDEGNWLLWCTWLAEAWMSFILKNFREGKTMRIRIAHNKRAAGGARFSEILLELGDGRLTAHTTVGPKSVLLPAETIVVLATSYIGLAQWSFFPVAHIGKNLARHIAQPQHAEMQPISSRNPSAPAQFSPQKGDAAGTRNDQVLAPFPHGEIIVLVVWLGFCQLPHRVPKLHQCVRSATPQFVCARHIAMVTLIHNVNSSAGVRNGMCAALPLANSVACSCSCLQANVQATMRLCNGSPCRRKKVPFPFCCAAGNVRRNQLGGMRKNKAQGRTLERFAHILEERVLTWPSTHTICACALFPAHPWLRHWLGETRLSTAKPPI